MSAQQDVPDGDVVEVRIPAVGAYVATLRLAAASLAVRCDLTIDDIEDLRLAVDEACALLLPHAGADSVLTAVFTLHPGHLAVTASVMSATATSPSPDRSGFAWSVLSALASEVEVDGSGGHLAITVSKRRDGATP